MGCELSTPSQQSFTAKVSPEEDSHIRTIITVIGPNQLKANEEDSSSSSQDKPSLKESISSDSIKRPLTRSSSVGSMLENRSPSDHPQSWFNRNAPRINFNRKITIDTSRARSNQPLVSLCANKLGLHEYPNGNMGETCDIYWHNVVYGDMNKVIKSPFSRVNKLPGMYELAKKISLTHAISSMQRLFPNEYDFYPNSWFLPAHHQNFLNFFENERRKGSKDLWFIVKPDEGAQGTGIYLINHPSQIKDVQQKQLIQEYIADPLLMGEGLKFDFRVYGVIRSLNPLSIYVAREGMARFCTEKYEKPTIGNFENLYAHLTNYSLNKSSEAYVHSNSLQEQMKGSKRLLSTVFHQLEARGVKTKKLWHDIKMILVKTTLAMLPEMMLHYEHQFFDAPGPQCFQIVGYDVMIRADGKPILLEVNAAPSLVTDHIVPIPGKPLSEGGQRVRSVVDEVIKTPLVRDTLLLVLGMLDDVNDKDQTPPEGKSVDDFHAMKQKRKPHLSEIFPTRYGAHSSHLLFLDKAMYIFMHFVHLKHGVNISVGGLKHFVKKCNLTDLIELPDVDEKAAEIAYKFVGEHQTSDGLPFHAFLIFLFFLAEKKFPYESDLLAKMHRLISYCDMNLRHYGVRSARLRRTEVGSKKNGRGVMEIYMLPGRVRARSELRNGKPNATDFNNNPNNLTLPKIHK